MANPTFDEYWVGVKERAAAAKISPVLETAREKYVERYDEAPVFRNGPSREEFGKKMAGRWTKAPSMNSTIDSSVTT